jgi:hypothetical protein
MSCICGVTTMVIVRPSFLAHLHRLAPNGAQAPPVRLAHMDAFGHSRRRVLGSNDEQGIAMLGVLLTVIVLGLMVVIMLKTLGGSPSGTGANVTIPGATTVPGAPTTTTPVTPESGAQAAAVSACQANYQAIETALSDYRALNGSSPAAGTAWATASTNNGPYMQTWPESASDYSINWNGTQLSVIPVKGAISRGIVGTTRPKTGCFAA